MSVSGVSSQHASSKLYAGVLLHWLEPKVGLGDLTVFANQDPQSRATDCGDRPMRVHPAVLLNISDFCAQSAGPPRFRGPLFGEDETAIECALASDTSMPVQETLELLRRTRPRLQLVGWFYVGYGRQPDDASIEDHDNKTVLLIDVPAKGSPIVKAFVGGKETDLRLESDEPAQVALEDAVDFNQALHEGRAKLILRDRIRAVRKQLASSDPQKVSEALYKYAMLKKVFYLHTNAARREDDFMYELLAEVVLKSDAQYKNRHP